MEVIKLYQDLVEREPTLAKGELEAFRDTSHNWTRRQWSKYLKSFETKRAESLIPPAEYDDLAERAGSIFENAQESANGALIDRVRFALESLTPRQQEVVDLLFFKSLSIRDAALEMRISRVRVSELKVQALKKLAVAVMHPPEHFPLVRGQLRNCKPAPK